MLDTSTESAQVRIERRYAAPLARVWAAWTDPQALSAWFGASWPGATTQAEVDLRVGGRYRIVSQLPDGGTNDVSGEYLELQPRRRLVFSWAWRSTPDRVSRVSIDFIDQGSHTELLFVHDRFFDDQARANHARGWASIFVHIDAFVQQASQGG